MSSAGCRARERLTMSSDTTPSLPASGHGEVAGLWASVEIDYGAAQKVDLMVERIRSAGFASEAEVFSNVYWAWLRVTSAYSQAHPYVRRPEPGMTPASALSVVDYTLRHWGPIIPGTPVIDDKQVLEAAADDEAWHREEDRRMRREAGEEFI